MGLKTKLPLFPSDEIDIGNNTYITISHLKSYIVRHHGNIAERYCILKKFNRETGWIDKLYAWHSIFDVLNIEGISEQIIKQMYGYREEKE